MNEAAEWVVWEAIAGILQLEDGRCVTVGGGDAVLVESRGPAVVFLDHKPAVRH